MLLMSWPQVPLLPLQVHTTSDGVMPCAAQASSAVPGNSEPNIVLDIQAGPTDILSTVSKALALVL